MKNRKKLLFFLLLGVVILTSAGTAILYAASQRNDAVHNKLSIPTLKGEIEENFTPDQPIQIGDSQTKDISIENTGDSSLFVRVMVFPEIKDSNLDDGLLAANIGEEILVKVGSDWIAGEDGYYYYLKSLEPEKQTASLFSEVALSDTLGTSYDNADFSMQIKSETVTIANHSYRKVWWNQDPTSAIQIEPLKTIDSALDTFVIDGD